MHNGRYRIYTDVTEITVDNVRKVVEETMLKHRLNVSDIRVLNKYMRGDVELVREKAIRPEVDIKAIDPIASQIVDFQLGYEHGDEISYTQRANFDAMNPGNKSEEIEKDDLRIVTLNEMMREIKKSSKDNKLARYLKVCGIGYRYIVPKKYVAGICPFDIYILNPLNAYVVYSNDAFCEPVCAVTYTTVNSLTTEDGNVPKKYGVWTKDAYYEFVDKDNNTGVSVSPNVIGEIPIIEYINNYDLMGSFEREIPLIDALNVVTSDRVNDICQQVQSILWLHNTKLDNDQKAELVDGGVIQTQANADGSDAKIQFVSAPLKQDEVQTLANSLKERILESAGVPKLSESQNATGDAMRITNGWHTAETKAKTSELTWRESEDATLEVCLKIIRMSSDNIPNDVGSLRISDIDYDMHRSENYDISSRVNSFITLVTNGCDISKSAMYCKITDDPLQFAKDSEENINKLRFAEKQNNRTPLEETDAKIDEITPDKTLASESIQPKGVAIK